MSETTTLEPVETSAAPTTTTSDAVVTPPSAAPDTGVQETVPAGEEREGGAQEPAAFDASAASPAEAYQAWREGKLKQADFEPEAWAGIADKVGRHQQSINDQQRRATEVRQANAQRAAALENLYPAKTKEVLTDVETLLEEAGVNIDGVTRRALSGLLDNHMHLDPRASVKAQAEEAALLPLVNTLGGGLVAAAVQLGASQTDAIEWVSSLNPADYAQAAISLGRRMGPQGDYVLKAEAARSEKEAVAAALRKERGENPERTAVGVGGNNSVSSYQNEDAKLLSSSVSQSEKDAILRSRGML